MGLLFIDDQDWSSDVDVVICLSKRLLQPGFEHWRLSQCPLIIRDSKSWAETESWESRKKERERTEVCCGSGSARTILSETSLCAASPARSQRRRRSAFFHPDRPASVTFFPWLCELQSPRWSREVNTSLCPLISSLHLAPHRPLPLTTRSHQSPAPCLRKVAVSSLSPGCFHSFTPCRSWHDLSV